MKIENIVIRQLGEFWHLFDESIVNPNDLYEGNIRINIARAVKWYREKIRGRN